MVIAMAGALSALLSAQQAPAPCLQDSPANRPYTRVRLLDVVASQTPVRAEYLIRTCGVRVPFTKELEADLKEVGAEPAVIEAVRAAAPQPAPPEPVKPSRPVAGQVVTNPKDGLQYVYIPAGRFRMGCASAADGPCGADETPPHDVILTKGFWMGQTEVTTGAYQRFARATGPGHAAGAGVLRTETEPGLG
jgi:formylglycine-generating enzyme required for sulfatase activity